VPPHKKSSYRVGSRYGFAFVIALAITGCASHAPIDVADCALNTIGPDRVAFTARLRSLTANTIQIVYVAASMSGDKGADGDDRRDDPIEYEFDGALLPSRWVTRRTSKTPEEAAFRIDRSIGSIDDCYVSAILFRDNTVWFRRTPDM
jgi:hypothetical protein